MGGHEIMFSNAQRFLIMFVPPAIYGSVWFWIRHDAAKFEREIPHDLQHKPWLVYSKGRHYPF